MCEIEHFCLASFNTFHSLFSSVYFGRCQFCVCLVFLSYSGQQFTSNFSSLSQLGCLSSALNKHNYETSSYLVFPPLFLPQLPVNLNVPWFVL
jgi:hypothetical protein